MINRKYAGVIGATGLVGQCLLPLLPQNGWTVRAFSRRQINAESPGVEWLRFSDFTDASSNNGFIYEPIESWICLASIWVLPDYFPMLAKFGARRVIALSSTSLFTKRDSPDPEEKATALKLSQGESDLRAWASDHGITWIILRPTLIYGLGMDTNVSQIARVIRRFGVFPLLGQASGLRQPLHAEDIALACLAALGKSDLANRDYNLSGGETLTYREMVRRIFIALNRRPRLIGVPLWVFRMAAGLLRVVPRYRHWSVQMAERMNTDLVFDHEDAARDLNFSPRMFHLTSKDLPFSESGSQSKHEYL